MRRSLYCLCIGVVVAAVLAACSTTEPIGSLSPSSTASQDSLITPSISTASTAISTPSSSAWQEILRVKIGHIPVYLAGFLDSSFGITAGYAGEVHYTNDGGTTWPKSTSSSLCRWGLDIIDEHVAWHCGNGSTISVTTDGGKNWNPVSAPTWNLAEPNQCRYLSFLDATTGWIANQTVLGSTTDGGKTWERIIVPEAMEEIAAISLLNPQVGYVLDKTQTLWITKDAGKTWSSDALQSKLNLTKDPLEIYSSPRTAMRFIDEQNGTIILQVPNPEKKYDFHLWAARTADSGKTWMVEEIPGYSMKYVVFLAHDGITLTLSELILNNEIIVLHREA